MEATTMLERRPIPWTSLLRSSHCATIVSVALAVSPASAQAQRTSVVTSRSSCPRCEILLDHVATLGEHPNDPPLGVTPFIRRDSNGNYYTANHLDRGVVYVFGPKGRFRRTVGSDSSVNKPLSLIQALLIGRGDTLTVFDPESRQYAVIAPAGSIVRSATFDGSVVANGYAQLPGGDIAISAYMRTPERVGFPLHKVSANGEMTMSFGPDSFVGAQQYQMNTERRIAPGAGGSIWTVFSARYILEHWDSNGDIDLRLERHAIWFPVDEGRDELTSARRPTPLVRALTMDRDGRLWTLIGLADSDWRDDVAERIDSDYARIWDTVVEVMDPAQRVLVASTRLDHAVGGFVDGEHVFSHRSRTAEGRTIYDVWHVRLSINGVDKEEEDESVAESRSSWRRICSVGHCTGTRRGAGARRLQLHLRRDGDRTLLYGATSTH